MSFESKALSSISLLLSMALASSMASGASAPDQTVTLTPTNFLFFGVSTTNNSLTAARNIATLSTNAGVMTGVCQGIWLDTELNKSTYALILSAITAQKNITIYYDPAKPSPWGNTAYCALTAATIAP
jgi:hypothetical protein